MKSINTCLSSARLLQPVLMLLLWSFFLISCDDDEGNPAPEPLNLGTLAQTEEDLNLFMAAVEQAGLSSALRNENSELTVFAPNNQAFEALLEQTGVALENIPQEVLVEILQYHIVSGSLSSTELSNGTLTSLNGETIEVSTDGGVTLNGSAMVVEADLEASNGVIHIINEVLQPTPEEPSIATLLSQDEDLSILAGILSQPAFSDILAAASNPESSLTVFAPTNTYFSELLNQLGKASANEIPEEVLRSILTYHILGEAYPSTELESMMYTTLQGDEISVSAEGSVTVNELAVTEADILASNGVVHKIGGVLLPAEARMAAGTVAGIAYFDKNFTTLVAALRQAELLNTLFGEGPYTVFAPTNAAFEAAGITDLSAFTTEELQEVLLYHVIGNQVISDQLTEGPVTTASGSEFFVSLTETGVYINGNSRVTAVDLEANNGVVHVLDGVLMPPSQNIAEIVVAQASAENPQFTLLLQAVERAGLTSTLAEGGPFTVFAPTDAAFEAAGFDAETIAATDPEVLQNLLLYHLLSETVFSVELNSGNITTVQGGAVAVDVEALTLTDEQGNTAALSTEALNILATNGVIHVIDAVLMPAP